MSCRLRLRSPSSPGKRFFLLIGTAVTAYTGLIPAWSDHTISWDKGFGIADTDDRTHVYCILQHLPQVREGDVLSLKVGIGYNAYRYMWILMAEQDPVSLRELPGTSLACGVVQAKHKIGLGSLVQHQRGPQ